MPKYTYADVIIDPEDPRAEIGAKYYFGDTPLECIALANSESFDESTMLTDIDGKEERPFAFASNTESGSLWYACIIRKKDFQKDDSASLKSLLGSSKNLTFEVKQ